MDPSAILAGAAIAAAAFAAPPLIGAVSRRRVKVRAAATPAE